MTDDLSRSLGELAEVEASAAAVLASEGWTRTANGWVSPDRRLYRSVWGACEVLAKDLRGALDARKVRP
ncbi:MAG TPA: hypothetical protein VFV33_18625 [Gemmatimonadaceae bacterium]|nr:hypothetical protein [Gemmatimonadaceae bacterium]